MRVWSIAALLVLATACASGAGDATSSQVSSPPPSSPGSPAATVPSSSAVPDRLTITAADDGETFTVDTHTRAQLNLGSPGEAWAAKVAGTAITLVEIHFEQDPGYQAWEIQIVEPGQADVTASSEDQSFSVRIIVME